MPLSATSVVSSFPNFGTKGGGMSNNGGTNPIKFVHLNPIQICGLVPMHDCAASECRQYDSFNGCKPNPVFGNIVSSKAITTSTYENDFNRFSIDVSIYSQNTSATTVTWKLQKCVKSIWTTVATLNNNNYGKFIPLNTYSTHKTYSEYLINWGLVLQLQGVGIYRITCNTSMRTLQGCLSSDSFWLRAWNCMLAAGTVKFEYNATGKIGDALNQGKVFDLCAINYYDSIRLYGFFGQDKITKYENERYEYGNGLQDDFKDKAWREYVFDGKLWGHEYHQRFQIYAMMAGTGSSTSSALFVSDYNVQNPDYAIKQLQIIKDSAYEPEYHVKNWNRLQNVQLKFQPATQSMIKSLCCDTALVI